MEGIAAKRKRSVGRPLKGADRRVRVSFTLPVLATKWLKQNAQSTGRSRSEIIEILLEREASSRDPKLGSHASLVEDFPIIFWDVAAAEVDPHKHREFIIERILEHGTLAALRSLFLHYSRDSIVNVIRRSRRISRKSALFWKSYLKIQGEIYCLEKESASPLSTPWE